MCVPVSEIVNELGDFRVKVGHGLVHLVFFEKGDADSLPVMSLWICLRGGVVVWRFCAMLEGKDICEELRIVHIPGKEPEGVSNSWGEIMERYIG